MNLILLLILVSNMQVTSYRSVPAQTDDSPYTTSTGEHVSPDGVAVSQDLLCKDCLKLHRRCNNPYNKTKLHYGQWIVIEEIGFKRINDVMNKRYKNHLDIWVATLKEEKEFHKKYKRKKLKAFILQEINL